MPDFDIDFDERRRGEVIRYVTEKYGDDRVAQIVTYGTIKAKQAIKDSARVLGLPVRDGRPAHQGDAAAVMGKDIPLSGIFDPTHPRYTEAGEFRGVHDEDPDAKEVVDTARGLEGLKRQWGVHAAGVIMSSEPLHRPHPDHAPRAGRPDHHPVRLPELRDARPAQDGLPRPAQPHDHRRRARATSSANRGEDIDLEALSQGLDDPATYELLARGDTLGVFQLDGGADALAAAPDAARQLRGHLRRRRALPAGPDGRSTRTPTTRCARTAAQPITPDPPRAGGAARGGPRRDLRPDRLPGAGASRSRRRSPATRSARPTCCAGRWARRRRRSSTPSSSASQAGMQANGYSDAAIKTLWDVLVPFADYALQQGALRGVRRWSPTGPPTSRRTTPPSTWPRC